MSTAKKETARVINRVVVFIEGPPASGKTEIAADLLSELEAFGDRVEYHVITSNDSSAFDDALKHARAHGVEE